MVARLDMARHGRAWTKKDYNSPEHIVNGSKAIARSNGVCQFCGHYPAERRHHWAAKDYPPPSEITPNDYTGLCKICHVTATTMRRHLSAGGDPWILKQALKKAIDECYMKSKSKATPRSSCTTERPDSTPPHLQTSKGHHRQEAGIQPDGPR